MSVWAVGWLAFAAVWAVGFGSRAAWLAHQRRRGRVRWFLFGAVLGPAGLLILEDAPPGTCASCLNPVAGWSMTCVACGEDVRTNLRVARLLAARGSQAAPAAPLAGSHPPAGAALGPRGPGPAPVRPEGPAERLARRHGPAASRAEPTSVAPRRAPDVRQPLWAPAAPVAARPAVAPPTESRRLDLALRPPIRLASCVFVEGTEGLVPGLWYEVTCDDGRLRVAGPPGSVPTTLAPSWPLTHIDVKTKGDRLVVSGTSESDNELRLVFQSTLDWTPLGLTREIDARRRALLVDAGDA